MSPARNNTIYYPLAALLALALYWLYPSADPHAPGTDNLNWRQPVQLDSAYPQLISPRRWPFDFTTFEGRFASRVGTDEAGRLELDPMLADTLEQTLLHLPENTSEEVLQRIVVLLRKSFPGSKGEQLAELFHNYAAYRREESRFQTPAAGGAKEALAALRNSIELQHKYLGSEAAERLYGERNALTTYLLSRREIREDSSLSPARKQERLDTLEREYQQRGLESEGPTHE
ncbi:MAG: lipase secretion chaperone [Cellvibrionaceae bacterium]